MKKFQEFYQTLRCNQCVNLLPPNFAMDPSKERHLTQGISCSIACRRYFSSLNLTHIIWRSDEVSITFFRCNFNVNNICNRSRSLVNRSNSREKISSGECCFSLVIFSNKRMRRKKT